MSPFSKIFPLPTATTSPFIGFSVALSGITIPPGDVFSSSFLFMITRSCNGLIFIDLPHFQIIVSTLTPRLLMIGTLCVISRIYDQKLVIVSVITFDHIIFRRFFAVFLVKNIGYFWPEEWE